MKHIHILLFLIMIEAAHGQVVRVIDLRTKGVWGCIVVSGKLFITGWFKQYYFEKLKTTSIMQISLVVDFA